MATKSILKDVVISDKSLASNFVDALTNPNTSKYKTLEISRKCETLKGEAIKKFFNL